MNTKNTQTQRTTKLINDHSRITWTLFTGLTFGGAIVLTSVLNRDPVPSAKPSMQSMVSSSDAGIVESRERLVSTQETKAPESFVSALPSRRVDNPVVTSTPEAQVSVEALELVPADDLDHAHEAELRMEAGDLPGAVRELRLSLYGHEPSTEELFSLGRLAREAKDLEIATQALERALEKDPKNAGVHLELARTSLDAKKAEKAEKEAQRAVQLDPSDALAWNVLGRAAMEKSHWQKSESALRRAVELAPTQAVMFNNLGLLYVKMHKGEEAVDALETAVELYGDEAPSFVFNNLGLAYEMQDKLEVARDAFEQAMGIDPGYARAALNLARVEKAIEKSLEVAETQPVPVAPKQESVETGSSPEPVAPTTDAPRCVRVAADLCE